MKLGPSERLRGRISEGPDSRSRSSASMASARRPPPGSATWRSPWRPSSGHLPARRGHLDRPGRGRRRRPTRLGRFEAWAFDPNPSLVRSGLLDGFAAEHGLKRIATGVDLLTGPHLVDSSFLAARSRSWKPSRSTSRSSVVRWPPRALGPLEIKTRGLETTPEAYRARLRPEGPNPATLLLIAGRSGSVPAIYWPTGPEPLHRDLEIGESVSKPGSARVRLALFGPDCRAGAFSKERDGVTRP